MNLLDKALDRLSRQRFSLILIDLLLLILAKVSGTGADRPKVVFIGAMNGRWYGDNAKHIFEYLESLDDVEFEYYWVTRSATTYHQLKRRHCPVLYQFSLKYLLLLSRCDLGIYTDSLRDILVNPMLRNIHLRTINLRHGRSVKRVRFARKNHKMNPSEVLERKRETDITAFATSTSDFISGLQEECLRLGISSHIVTGYPRNDELIRNAKASRSEGPLQVLYAPSWRHGRLATRFFPFEGMNLSTFDAELGDRNIEMFLRPHVGEIETASFPDLQGLENIKLFDHRIQPDINSSLHNFDMLISDYSALIHDYLLLDRPVILVPYDYDDFAFENGFLYDYHANAPGIIVETEEEFGAAVLERAAFRGQYAVARRRLRDLIHEYQDDGSCSRVHQLIRVALDV